MIKLSKKKCKVQPEAPAPEEPAWYYVYLYSGELMNASDSFYAREHCFATQDKELAHRVARDILRRKYKEATDEVVKRLNQLNAVLPE